MKRKGSRIKVGERHSHDTSKPLLGRKKSVGGLQGPDRLRTSPNIANRHPALSNRSDPHCADRANLLALSINRKRAPLHGPDRLCISYRHGLHRVRPVDTVARPFSYAPTGARSMASLRRTALCLVDALRLIPLSIKSRSSRRPLNRTSRLRHLALCLLEAGPSPGVGRSHRPIHRHLSTHFCRA